MNKDEFKKMADIIRINTVMMMFIESRDMVAEWNEYCNSICVGLNPPPQPPPELYEEKGGII